MKPLVTFEPHLPGTPGDIKSIADLERQRFQRISRMVIKVARLDTDVSQDELAKRLSWTRNQVANLESGRRAIGIEDFIMIARALRIEPGRLLQRVLQW